MINTLHICDAHFLRACHPREATLFRVNLFSFRERIKFELERLVYFGSETSSFGPLTKLNRTDFPILIISFRLFLRWQYKKDSFTRVPVAELITAPSVGQTSTVLYKTSPSALSTICPYLGTKPVVQKLLCEYNKQSYNQSPLARLQSSKV